MRKLITAGAALILTLVLAGCGGRHTEYLIAGPGLVVIDDSTSQFSPLLKVIYTIPPSPPVTVQIFSDLQSDGDIAFDPVLNTYTATRGPSSVLFGVDSLSANLTEYRAFLTFPLDGATGQPVIPGTAVIDSAILEVFVDQVSFAPVVPTFLDLVSYPFRGLGSIDPSTDFNAAPYAFRTLNFFDTDVGNYPQIDVTPLMQEAQVQGFFDFQVRFSLDPPSRRPLSRAPATIAGRTVHPPPRAPIDGSLNRESFSAKPLTPADLASRHR